MADNVHEILGAIGYVGAKWGVQKCPRRRFFLSAIYEITFRQLRNGRFSPNLATTRVSWLKRIFERNLGKVSIQGSNLWGQTGTSLRAGCRSRIALQRDTVYCSLQAREFPRSR